MLILSPGFLILTDQRPGPGHPACSQLTPSLPAGSGDSSHKDVACVSQAVMWWQGRERDDDNDDTVVAQRGRLFLLHTKVLCPAEAVQKSSRRGRQTDIHTSVI